MAARRRRDNLVIGVLAVLAVIGGGHAVLDAFSTPPPGPSEDSTVSLIARSTLAESFAREFVVVYLSSTAGQQDRILEFVASGQQAALPPTARQVSDPVVVYVTRTLTTSNADIWAVTVSVRIAKKTGTTDDTRQYYRVAVSVIDGRLRALSLPAAVEPPSPGADLALDYATPCAAETPLAQVASGFLQALLTGTGDIARYTTPDSGISALRPTPFTTAETTTVSADNPGCGTSGSSARVLASVNPKLDGAAAPTLAYPLRMVRAAGQWQVRSVDPVPALRLPLAVDSGQLSNDTAAAPTTSKAPASTVSIPPATQH
ncbi:conjugal transfer protein [Nocardia sp. NBC_01327]|uniref:conjugal transfer protein n=1 Tax=Nocardia sp. NBC_01327 TaxID=2903593 RepID=UPI002E15BB97|nr:conjugal transfer protein [Nocardia sp. NBC_01327]